MKTKIIILFVTALLLLNGCGSVPLTGRRQVLLVPDTEVLTSSLTQYSEYMKTGGSRNLVGISIYLCQPKKKKLSVCHSMQVCPKEFDFCIERLCCGV